MSRVPSSATAADGPAARNAKLQRVSQSLGGPNRLRCPVCRIGLATPDGQGSFACNQCHAQFTPVGAKK
jgi:hypothetical protein